MLSTGKSSRPQASPISAKLFTNLDELEVGDRFTITVLNRVLTYEVDQISIVLPTEIDQLLPTEGMDYI